MEKYIPAPIDEKSGTLYWIPEIFDNADCVLCTTRPAATGFINYCPVYVSWHENHIVWRVIENDINNYEETLETIRERLEEFEDSDSYMFSEITSWGRNALMQKFFLMVE